MRRGAFFLVFGAALAVTVIATVIFVFLYGFWGVLAPSVSGAILLAALFLPRFQLGEIRLTPDRSLPALAHRLRLAQYSVKEERDRLVVRIGRIAGAKLRARAIPEGTEIRYQVDATTNGWGIVMICLLIPEFGLVGLALVLYIFARVQRFVEGPAMRALETTSVPGERPAEDEVRASLVDSLSESRRIAQEALETDRSSYQDWLAVLALVAMVAWLVLFIGMAIAVAPSDLPQRMWNALLSSVALTLAVATPAAFLIRRRFRPRILATRAWLDRLQTAIVLETSGASPEAATQSVFELLADASREVPAWIEIHRKAGLSRDPAAGFLVVAMAIWAVAALEGALVATGYGILQTALWVGVGVGLSAVLYVFYLRWKRKWEADARRSLEDWNRRVEGLKTAMERFLEDL